MRATSGALMVGAVLAVGGSVAAVSAIDSAATVEELAERGESVILEPEPPTARYRVSFIVEWGRSTHPATLPPNSHTSPPVVIAHGSVGDLFVPGTLASPGIEAMAEVGSTSTLVSELRSRSSVTQIDTGRRIDGPGIDVFEVTVARDAPLVSLVSMLAPSPDWFVGVRDVNVFPDGRWLPSLDLDLGAYDAGTDSGPRFTSANANTSPAQVISGPRDGAFGAATAEGRFGRVVFERLS